MVLAYQLKAILIKELIQIKRNICLFLLELLCPIFLIFIFLCLRKIFPIENISFESANNNNKEFIIKNGTFLTNKVNSPSEVNYANELNIKYKNMLAQCRNNPRIALIGENFPTDIKNKIEKHSWELNRKIENELFLNFPNKKEFFEYLNSPKYGTKNSKICFGKRLLLRR